MKLLIDLTSLYDHLTGIERFSANLSAGMIRLHPEHTYILLFKNEIHPGFREGADLPNVECHVLSCGNRVLFYQLLLPLTLYRLRADLYFFPAFCAPWLFFSSRIVDTVHDLSDFECHEGKSFLKTLYSRLGIYHARHCSRHIVTVSGFSRDRLSRLLGIPEDKISVISNGISAEFTSEGSADPSRSFAAAEARYRLPKRYLLSVSTLEPRKNIRLLIRAFLRLQDEFPDLYLVLCGRAGWNLKEVFGETLPDPAGVSAEGRLSDRIRVTGYVEDKDLPQVYRHAEWFVFPSKYEGFGIPPLEAMGTGCPVLSSDAASLPEVLGDGAVYFQSGNEDSLVSELRACLLMEDAEKRALIRKGKERASLYTWEDSAEKLNALLQRLI